MENDSSVISGQDEDSYHARRPSNEIRRKKPRFLKSNKDNVLLICLINARSVMPKLCSLADTLNELQTDICVLTETWIREDGRIKEQLEDFECLSGYSMIRRDRVERRGGGIAVCFDKNRISMTPVHMNETPFKIVAALVRRVGQ